MNETAKADPVRALLPCPFCGGAAERIDFGPGDEENEGGSCIACTRCQSSGPVEFGRKENFISNWNRRTALAQQAGAAHPDDVTVDAHCATCACNPSMTPAVRFDLSPAMKDGAVRDCLIAMGWTPPAPQPAIPEVDLERVADFLRKHRDHAAHAVKGINLPDNMAAEWVLERRQTVRDIDSLLTQLAQHNREGE